MLLTAGYTRLPAEQDGERKGLKRRRAPHPRPDARTSQPWPGTGLYPPLGVQALAC